MGMIGRVVSINIAGAAGAPMTAVEIAQAVTGRGLEGDRYFVKAGTFSSRPGEGRHVTLIESEAVEAMNAKLGATLAPGNMRRNIVTRGIALNHLVGREFRAGTALLNGIRLCEPCDYLQSLTQQGVLKQLIHRGGLRANILGDGIIRPGDPIAEIEPGGVPLDDALEQNKQLIRRYYEEMWNPWSFALAGELLADEMIFRGSLGTETKGRAQFCDYMRQVQRAFPDFHNEILELAADEDRVVARLNYTGTHRGEIFGVAPTRKSNAYSGAAFFRIAHGRVAEGWVLGDLLTLLRQLGAQRLP
jgi:steroid delta-isomerase-like uncharacterized protein